MPWVFYYCTLTYHNIKRANDNVSASFFYFINCFQYGFDFNICFDLPFIILDY